LRLIHPCGISRAAKIRRNSFMRLFTKVSHLLFGLAILASPALAHPGHGEEPGMIHVLTSFEHIGAFLLIGVTAAIVMTIRRMAAILAANAVLALFLVIQAGTHAVHGGWLFGIETALAGAALALGAWRVTHILYARRMNQRMHPGREDRS
jgi:hypothetical protein